jgi:NAD(P) transhydrogenase
VVLTLQSGKKTKADCILFANGSSGNTNTIAIENKGLLPNSRGSLEVNNQYKTEIDNIYAVGDVIGYPNLASAAYDQGRIAAGYILKLPTQAQLIEDIPTGIYTIPEMSSVGKTEQQLTAARIPYEVGRASFKHLARAQISNSAIGSLKILFHRETK